MKAVYYTRVSTEEQVKGYSLDSQKEKCIKYIELNEWTLHDQYIEDGYSAKDLDRPEMKRLIRNMQQQKFDILVVVSLDRLTRSVKDLYYFLDLLEETNVGLKSINESIDTTTPSGRLHLNQLAAFAEWERENISSRMVSGKEQKAKRGGMVGAPLPYGYHYDDHKKIVIDPAKASIVKRIFNEYQKRGMFSIAKMLNSEKIPSPSNARWSMPGIKHILENPFYIGEIHFNRRSKAETIISEGSHEPIISKDLFQRTKEIMSNRLNHTGDMPSSYPFSGVLKCSRCGGAMTGTKFARTNKKGERKTYYFYHCNSRRIGDCDSPQISETRLEELLFTFDWSSLETAASSDFTPLTESNNADMITVIKAQLDKVRATKKRWQLAFGEGVIDINEFRELSQMSKDQEEKLTEKIESLIVKQNEQPTYDITNFVEQVRQIKSFWHRMNREEKHEFVVTVINKLTIEVDAGQPVYGGRKCKIVELLLN